MWVQGVVEVRCQRLNKENDFVLFQCLSVLCTLYTWIPMYVSLSDPCSKRSIHQSIIHLFIHLSKSRRVRPPSTFFQIKIISLCLLFFSPQVLIS